MSKKGKLKENMAEDWDKQNNVSIQCINSMYR